MIRMLLQDYKLNMLFSFFSPIYLALELDRVDIVLILMLYGYYFDPKEFSEDSGVPFINHISNEKERHLVLWCNKREAINLSLIAGERKTFKFLINSDRNFSHITNQCFDKTLISNKDRKLVNDYLKHWSPGRMYLYSDKNKKLTKLLMLIYNRIGNSINFHCFLNILQFAIVFESKK